MPINIFVKTLDDYKNSSINLDITDKCLLKCPNCMRTNRKTLHKRGSDISLADFEKIAKFFPSLMFCGNMSDPIYHPKFIDILKICDRHSREVKIHTNGWGKKGNFWPQAYELTRLEEKRTPRYTWKFALDGLPNESHKYRVNQKGEEVWEIMKQGATSGCDIEWHYIVFRYNQDHIDQARQMARDNGITFVMIESSRWKKDDPLKPTKHALEDYSIPIKNAK